MSNVQTSEGVAQQWLVIARKELGQKEIAGEQDNQRILEYHKATALKASDDETPWCSAFVNWVMQQVGVEGTRSAAARSWLTWGKEIKEPKAGCIAVLRRGSGWKGHVGFVVGCHDDTIALLGGNQGDAVSVAWYPTSKVLGYRWPA